MGIYLIRQWIRQTAKRLGPRLTSVVPGPGQSIWSTGRRWRRHVSPHCIRPRYSRQPCKSRRYTDHSWFAPDYSPLGQCRCSSHRWRYLSWERASCMCLFHHSTFSNTCPCRLPECSFYSHLQCHCMYNTSKPSLIKKKRNKKKNAFRTRWHFNVYYYP